MGHLHSIKCTKNKKGGEAYMVKHLLCKQRVAGSSPVFAFGSSGGIGRHGGFKLHSSLGLGSSPRTSNFS